MFIWSNEKCDVTRNKHPLNPNKELVLKNMNIMFLEFNFEFQKLSLNNTLLIDDYLYKCVGNVPFCISYPNHLIQK